jgi:hypothetical protein
MPETLFDTRKTDNAENKILNYLMHSNSLTTLEAWQKFHTSELRTYISRLRKRGYDITGERIKVDCGDGHKANIKRFRIEK